MTESLKWALGFAFVLHLGLLFSPMFSLRWSLDQLPDIESAPLVLELVALTEPTPPSPPPPQPQEPPPSVPPEPASSEEEPPSAEPPSEEEQASPMAIEEMNLAELETLPPDLIRFHKPAYPEVARRRGWEGVVVVEFTLSADGRIGQPQVIRSSGHPPLDRAALQAIGLWRFAPRADRPQGQRLRQAIRFELE